MINISMKILDYILKLFNGDSSSCKVEEKAPLQEIKQDLPKEFIMQNQITKNFTLAELTYSDTAKSKGIKNMPTEEEYKNMVILCEKVLQPIRDTLGKPVKINSCYRGKQLNEAVGGAKTSQHCSGQAADIEIMGMSNYDLAVWIRDNLDFDQLILEYATNLSADINSGWVHVSYKVNGNRHQCLTIKSAKSGYKVGLIK